METRVLIAAACTLLAACAPTRTVQVQSPVIVPGPTQYVPVPAELTQCEDTGPPPSKGQPLGDLFAWSQRTRAASVECRAKMEQIRALGR